MIEFIDTTFSDLPTHYMYSETKNSNAPGLIVFMPSALNNNRDRKKIIYSRSTWADGWPNDDLIFFADPAVQQHELLNGAWYIHPKYDVINHLSSIVLRHAISRNIPNNRIVFYGSSLGGFGALMCASEIPGARAFVEVPQIDFENWLQSAITAVEKYILFKPIKDFRKEHPERISVLHRFLKNNRIPQFIIHTNCNDRQYDEQRNFLKWTRGSSLQKSGMNFVIENDIIDGHAVFTKEQLVSILNTTPTEKFINFTSA